MWPTSREAGENIQIKVGKLSENSALSAAPSVVKQEESKADDQNLVKKFKEKNSLAVSTSVDKKKSNFASAKYKEQSVSGDSKSDGSSSEFDYSKYVLENKL